MSPIQQMLLGAGGVAEKKFIDDVFSTYLFKGNAGTQAINNGINLAGKGGLVWTKNRDSAFNNFLYDTERGVQKYLISDDDIDEQNVSTSLTAFNSNGFTLGASDYGNITNGNKATSWTFRKAKGFFDVVTYTGNGTARTIAHNLGSVPGCVIVKKYDGSDPWYVWHRGLSDNTKTLSLNSNGGEFGGQDIWNSTIPTATEFSVGTSGHVNENNKNYVAYLFAGGESTAATARSVEFDGSGDKLSLAASDDFHLTGDFTIEGWFYPRGSNNEHFWSIGEYGNTGGILFYIYSNKLYVQESGTDRLLMDPAPPQKQWSHIALVRSGSTINLYINGTSVKNWTYSNDYGSSSEKEFYIGGSQYSVSYVNISNLRVVKGTAVYTSSFRPPTEPLTNITNTKLLCCNDSSTTGSTVTPGTITANGNPTASTDSPFDDPAGFVFGESGSENVIKTGSYTGNTTNYPEIYVGFEPQWILIKNTNLSTEQWFIIDNMRGIFTDANDQALEASRNVAEMSYSLIDLTPTGFKVTTNDDKVNNNGGTYVYVAIRRPDGYVGKPLELGTLVFAASYNTSNAPWFKNNNFPVDVSIHKRYDATEHWYQGSRLQGTRGLRPSDTVQESVISTDYWKWDYMDGWNAYPSGTAAGNYISYQFKRHAGFDVVCYEGNSNNTDGANAHRHSLAKPPEMIWIKARSGGTYSGVTHWSVSHKGLNGGTNPWQYTMQLNQNNAEAATSNFGNTAPTSEVFYVGEPGNARTNHASTLYIAMLFASVDGISKVGYYTGTGGTRTIPLGFQPRFLIYKKISSTQDWFVLDTTRGWGSGDDKYLELNNDNDQDDFPFGEPTSEGYTIGDYGNSTGAKFIYYAHA